MKTTNCDKAAHPFLLLATGTINSTAVFQLAPPQTSTSSQIKAAAAAMCIEFRPFLRVSCSYQGSDKLISQALTFTGLPNGTPLRQELTFSSVIVVEGELKRGGYSLTDSSLKQRL